MRCMGFRLVIIIIIIVGDFSHARSLSALGSQARKVLSSTPSVVFGIFGMLWPCDTLVSHRLEKRPTHAL